MTLHSSSFFLFPSSLSCELPNGEVASLTCIVCDTKRRPASNEVGRSFDGELMARRCAIVLRALALQREASHAEEKQQPARRFRHITGGRVALRRRIGVEVESTTIRERGNTISTIGAE